MTLYAKEHRTPCAICARYVCVCDPGDEVPAEAVEELRRLFGEDFMPAKREREPGEEG